MSQHRFDLRLRHVTRTTYCLPGQRISWRACRPASTWEFVRAELLEPAGQDDAATVFKVNALESSPWQIARFQRCSPISEAMPIKYRALDFLLLWLRCCRFL